MLACLFFFSFFFFELGYIDGFFLIVLWRIPRYVPCMPPDDSLTVSPHTPATSGTSSQNPDCKCGHSCAATSGGATADEGGGLKFHDGGIFGYAHLERRWSLPSRYS